MARLPFTDLVSITDKSKGTNCAKNKNRYHFKYVTVFSTTIPNLGNLNRGEMSEETFFFNFVIGAFMAIRTREWASLFPRINPQYNIENYVFIHAVIFIYQLYYLAV